MSAKIKTTATSVLRPADERVTLPLTGMTCAACARRIERKLSSAPGVRQANVNFATARATVEYDPQQTGVNNLIESVRAIGYDAAVEQDQAAAQADEQQDLWRRFIVAAVLSAPGLLIAMTHGRSALFNVWWINWVQLALTLPVVGYSGWPFYRGAWAALRHRAADMNTLIATGTGAAFLYSFVATVAPQLVATAHAAMPGMSGVTSAPVYFEAASVIIALILLGRLLEARARGKTNSLRLRRFRMDR